jgi:hypothetical protein
LKLGNLFLGNRMEIKIGDFGLATRVANDDERKQYVVYAHLSRHERHMMDE